MCVTQRGVTEQTLHFAFLQPHSFEKKMDLWFHSGTWRIPPLLQLLCLQLLKHAAEGLKNTTTWTVVRFFWPKRSQRFAFPCWLSPSWQRLPTRFVSAQSAESHREKHHLLPWKHSSNSTYPRVFISAGKSPLPEAPWVLWFAEIATWNTEFPENKWISSCF